MSLLFSETMAALSASLQCGLIASWIDGDAGVKALDASDQEIVEYAAARGFTFIPLSAKAGAAEREITHLAEVDLRSRQVVERRRVGLADVVASSASIGQTIPMLASRPVYLVLTETHQQKLLTVSDLNRLPVRTYLHTLLDHLESVLAAAIGEAYPDDRWFALLSESRQAKVRELHELKQRSDFDTCLIDCTTLSDKATILARSEGLRQEIGHHSRGGVESEASAVIRLRNRILHNLPPLDESVDNLRDHLSHQAQLTKKADLAWLSRTVDIINRWIKCLSWEPHA